MKNLIGIGIFIGAIFLALTIAESLHLAYDLGMYHAIRDSRISVNDYAVMIELDGELYLH